jgi:hypothetical protein
MSSVNVSNSSSESSCGDVTWTSGEITANGAWFTTNTDASASGTLYSTVIDANSITTGSIDSNSISSGTITTTDGVSFWTPNIVWQGSGTIAAGSWNPTPPVDPMYLALREEIDELKRGVQELKMEREARELRFKDSIEITEPAAKRVLDI